LPAQRWLKLCDWLMAPWSSTCTAELHAKARSFGGLSPSSTPHSSGAGRYSHLLRTEGTQPMDNDDFYADCPHCDRHEFRDEDHWFEHVSTCEWEQQQADLHEEE
jgi:hypothetical protein